MNHFAGNEADAINTHISILTENRWKFSCTLCGKENVQKGTNMLKVSISLTYFLTSASFVKNSSVLETVFMHMYQGITEADSTFLNIFLL